LQHARQLLFMQDLSIKQIAAMLGYKNQFYFSRAFKREFGIPPTEVRGTHSTANKHGSV